MRRASVVNEVQDVAFAGKAVDEKEKTRKENTMEKKKKETTTKSTIRQ